MLPTGNQQERIILGIDPGTNIMGYGLLHCKDKAFSLMNTGIVHLSKLKNHSDKLKMIFDRSIYLIDTYKPAELAIEAPFYGNNIQSMLKLGRAQGIAIAAALSRDIPVFEYAPRKIKQSITGNGAASKEQVAQMLQVLCKFDEMPSYLDATDGLAVAVCHFFQGKALNHNLSQPKTKGKSNSWSDFVKSNPNRKID